MNLIRKIKSSNIWNWWVSIQQQLQNQRENRELVGIDRDRNKYYQYYSYYGLPIRREVRFHDEFNLLLKDLVYYRWLYQFDYDPPTQTEKEQFYLDQQIRFQKALEWSRKDDEELQKIKQKRFQLLLRDEAMFQLQQQYMKQKQLTIKTKRQ